MKKQDLKTGMRVRIRSGKTYLVVKQVETDRYGFQEIGFVRDGGFLVGTDYNDDLTVEGDSSCDIVEIFTINKSPQALLNNVMLDLTKLHSIWKRTNLIDKQIELLNALKVLGYNYLAKDANGKLYTYIDVPELVNEVFWTNEHYMEVHNEELISLINRESKEPFEIK